MGMALFSKNKNKNDSASTMQKLKERAEYPSGPIARRFFNGVDRAVDVQSPAIHSYVEKLKSKHSDKSLAEQQAILDKHFKNLATTSGAGTGGIAAVPGLGTMMAVAGIAGESFVLLEACALYALASADLHGLDISDEEHRRAIVLMAVSGATGKELIDALVEENAITSVKTLRGLTKMSGKDMVRINNVLGRYAFRQVRRRFGSSMFKKLLPFGVGAALGAKANRKIAGQMVEQMHSYLKSLD
ncbi:MAG TPA: EcsC family protein [Candidatus Corynebacterium gallistercoris]|uniref:EcsC family protein n=1 Tax=Candidatus Corynebacterium gallistercoris TaxID=2838530 RepID=A0A9D1UPD3_9CORY|nr:EcsC family protein [Candidatus Corynebacterium gallistercoris]